MQNEMELDKEDAANDMAQTAGGAIELDIEDLGGFASLLSFSPKTRYWFTRRGDRRKEQRAGQDRRSVN